MKHLIALGLLTSLAACATSQPPPLPCPICQPPRPAVIPPGECQTDRPGAPIFEVRALPPPSNQVAHLSEAARQAIDYADTVRVYAVDGDALHARCAEWARTVAVQQGE